MPVVFSTSSRAFCIVAGRAFTRLRKASGGSYAGNEESDIPLDVLVLSCELTHVLGPSRFPWLSDPLPSLL